MKTSLDHLLLALGILAIIWAIRRCLIPSAKATRERWREYREEEFRQLKEREGDRNWRR